MDVLIIGANCHERRKFIIHKSQYIARDGQDKGKKKRHNKSVLHMRAISFMYETNSTSEVNLLTVVYETNSASEVNLLTVVYETTLCSISITFIVTRYNFNYTSN
jgi:hypothetical protein